MVVIAVILVASMVNVEESVQVRVLQLLQCHLLHKLVLSLSLSEICCSALWQISLQCGLLLLVVVVRGPVLCYECA